MVFDSMSYFPKTIRLHGKIKIAYYFTVMLLLFAIFFIINTRFKYRKIEDVSSNDKQMYMAAPKATTESNGMKTTGSKQRLHGMKYILLMTDPKTIPFEYLGQGTSVFEKKLCKWSNCYVTDNPGVLRDYKEFDVLAFSGPQLINLISINSFMVMRSVRQKYVYANIESAANYPICDEYWNGFFNWTWTYRLNSDAVWGYFVIRSANHSVIGPSLNIKWIKMSDMDPINNDLKTKLKTKKHAAAWFVSNCKTTSRRESFVSLIRQYLLRFNLHVDVYGACGTLKCPFDTLNNCLQMLERDYYFYFAFENSFSEDYVTEKVLYALKHNTVPVVFGGANYSRFLPPGTYLNALELGPKGLARKMNYIIENPAEYHNFFRWKKYYSFHYRHESPSTDDYCHFCAMINDEKLMTTTTVYEHLDTWWTDNNICLKW